MNLTSPNAHRRNSGFALPLALAVLMIVSAIGLGIGAAVHAETRGVTAALEDLQAEELARSGQELATFLGTRGLGSGSENLSGLPVTVVQPAMRYRATIPEGTVDLFLESETGKLSLPGGSQELLIRFFSRWTGNATQADNIVTRLEAWRTGPGLSKVNPARYPLNMENLAAIEPFSRADFQPYAAGAPGRPELRPGLLDLVTTAPGGTGINPNFASEFVLRGVPGLTVENVAAIVTARSQHFFRNVQDLRQWTGIPADSAAIQYLRFDRGGAPAVLSLATVAAGAVASERRVFYTTINHNFFTGALEQNVVLAFIERDVFPEFAQQADMH